MSVFKRAGIRRVIAATVAAMALCAPAFADEVSGIAALLHANQYTDALSRADSYLARHPDDPQIRFLKGLALTGLERREEAIRHFVNLVDDHRSMPEPYNNLAVLYAAGGQYNEARIALEKAVELNPAYTLAHENLADMHMRLAIQSFASTLKLDPANASARAKYAALLSAIGQSSERPDTGALAAQEAELRMAIQAWAKAWSARDVDAYIAFYSPDFRTARHAARADWEAERRARLTEASFIQVEAMEPQISIDGTKATSTFRQRYRSDRITSNDRKTLRWERQGDSWKIIREDSSRSSR